jgi:hypothetical protein
MEPLQNPALLVIAHPGHELRAFGWMMRNRPQVWVLTDGSGRNMAPRIETTRASLSRHGATIGGWFGPYSDREIYSWVLEGNVEPFVECAASLADRIESEGIGLVVGDAREGRIMSHDVLRFALNAAVVRARKKGTSVRNFDFVLDSIPRQRPSGGGAISLSLNDEEFAAKYAAAQNYEELKTEVDKALQLYGEAPFRTEIFEPVEDDARLDDLPSETPHYERHGEEQVKLGVYPAVIRYRDHVLPLAQEIRRQLGV